MASAPKPSQTEKLIRLIDSLSKAQSTSHSSLRSVTPQTDTERLHAQLKNSELSADAKQVVHALLAFEKRRKQRHVIALFDWAAEICAVQSKVHTQLDHIWRSSAKLSGPSVSKSSQFYATIEIINKLAPIDPAKLSNIHDRDLLKSELVRQNATQQAIIEALFNCAKRKEQRDARLWGRWAIKLKEYADKRAQQVGLPTEKTPIKQVLITVRKFSWGALWIGVIIGVVGTLVFLVSIYG